MIDHLTDESEEEELPLPPQEDDNDVELDPSLDEDEGDDEADDSEVDTEEPVDHDAEERRAAALLLQKGYNVSRANQAAAVQEAAGEDEDEDEGPDPLMDPVGFRKWVLAQATEKAREDQAARLDPILRPSLAATIKARVIEAGAKFVGGLSPEGLAALDAEIASKSIEDLEAEVRNPFAGHTAAAICYEMFPPKAAKKAPVGIAGAPAPTPGTTGGSGGGVGVQVPEHLKAEYKKYLSIFKDKDTRENRAEFMSAQ